MRKPNVSIYFDSRNMNKGFYSVKWSVYFDGKQKQFSSGLVLNEKDVLFLKTNKNKLPGRVRDEYLINLWNRVYGEVYFDEVLQDEKEGILIKGLRALAKIENFFSFEMFASVVSGNYIPEGQQKYPNDLIAALNNRACRLKLNDDISNANLFESTSVSFARFAVYKKISSKINTKIPFQIITPLFLKDYERWMLKFGKASQKKDGAPSPASITTIAIYCRNVRTVCNEAKEAGIISDENYPFHKIGKAGFKIPKANNNKKALDEEIIAQIFNFKCKSGSTREMARDLWLFSYFSNGLNFTDICSIRRSELNLKQGFIEIYREKTKETKREDLTKIHISLLPETIKIIDKWGGSDLRQDAFVFPFLSEDMSAERRKAVIKQVIKNTNYHMGMIAKELEIDVPIKTYEARHSFATTLLRSEAPLAFISQSLGHSSFKTTQSYLGSFQDEKTKEYMSLLIPKQKEEKSDPA